MELRETEYEFQYREPASDLWAAAAYHSGM